ncbi:hypothetical protein [Herbaspirillum sp. YR522]|uniref:hypothetical protein n=1 Tax=Herbaspirillum sp. YR522 TaxID=1144342 RepID=UPI0012FC8556|nr:hypothetical protein [Herbaspirillum sp. YR522]
MNNLNVMPDPFQRRMDALDFSGLAAWYFNRHRPRCDAGKSMKFIKLSTKQRGFS